MKKVVTYGAGLIALYLVVYHGTRSGRVATQAAGGIAEVVKSFQGRG